MCSSDLPITRYTVQWHTDDTFSSPHFNHIDEPVADTDGVFSTSFSVTASTEYWVRVLAYNADGGFSDPAIAVPVRGEVQAVAVLQAVSTTAVSLTFDSKTTDESVVFNDGGSPAAPTSAADVQDLLEALDTIASVDVRLHVDDGVAAMYYVTFLPEAGDVPPMTSSGGGNVVITTLREGVALSSLSSTSAVVAPGAVEDLNLSVVSDTELGVRWKAPSTNGGSSITHYVIEWDTNYRFEGAGGVTDAAFRTLVAVADVRDSTGNYGPDWTDEFGELRNTWEGLQYTIGSITTDEQYYVRVSAVNAAAGVKQVELAEIGRAHV